MSEKSAHSSFAVPAEVIQKIRELREVEVTLGHLPPAEWQMAELLRRTQDPHHAEALEDLETQSDDLFFEVCEMLHKNNWTFEAIAQAINATLNYEGGPRYCSADEVKECLGVS